VQFGQSDEVKGKAEVANHSIYMDSLQKRVQDALNNVMNWRWAGLVNVASVHVIYLCGSNFPDSNELTRCVLVCGCVGGQSGSQHVHML
jgi:hypothetical protein